MNELTYESIADLTPKSKKLLDNYIDEMEIFDIEKKCLKDFIIALIRTERTYAAIKAVEYLKSN